MKTAIIFLVFISLNSDAQISIENLSLIDSSKNILYLGIDNEIIINNINNTFKKIKLKTINSEISEYVFQNEANKFIIYPLKQGIDTLFVFNEDKCIFKKEFNIERVGTLKCIIGKYLSNKLKKENIIENPSLNLIIPNCYLKRINRVISFEVFKKQGTKITPLYDTTPILLRDTFYSIDIETGIEKINILESIGTITHNSGNRLTNYQIDEIKTLKRGDFLHFEHIKVNCPSGATRKIQNLDIEIIQIHTTPSPWFLPTFTNS